MDNHSMSDTSMHDDMHNTFWLEDRIAVAFAVKVQPNRTLPTDAAINRELRQQVDSLQAIVKGVGFTLHFFGEKDRQDDESQADSAGNQSPANDGSPFPSGVYLFRPTISVERIGATGATGVGFLHLLRLQPGNADEKVPAPGSIAQVVNQINHSLRQNKANELPTSITSAAPVYLCGATSSDKPISQGCPLSPPIPVAAEASCPASPGLWPITLPELSADLQAATGNGVTVIVLDTLPSLEQIQKAAEVAGDTNHLLQDVAHHVRFTYPHMHDGLDIPGPLQPRTGKDIHGRSVGFKMPDHGIFVAGIIRSLAPQARIECIRVLNDMCTGSEQTLIDTLNTIYGRMSSGGDLHNTCVVINLSLVIPDNGEITRAGIDPSTIDMTHEHLRETIQYLVDLGAVFVASAGNEGDQRYHPMGSERPNALYPAAFAYDGLIHPERMIPVGAVDKDGNVTTYSCYPGLQGFATYGGDTPPESEIEDGGGYDMTAVKKIDAPIGLYTAPFYPALSIDDPHSTYPAPNASGWAYWIGTSFATPIVSAMAARALELNPDQVTPPNVPVPPPIVSGAATRQTSWTNLGSMSGGMQADHPPTSTMGAMIWAVQCKPDEPEDEMKAQVHVLKQE